MEIEIAESEERAYRHSRNKDSSERLLKLLKFYHGPKPKKVIRAIQCRAQTSIVRRKPEGSLEGPKPRFWFSIEEVMAPTSRPILVADIKLAITQYFRLSQIELDSARRTATVVYPRQIAMFLARAYTVQSFPEIGRRFGGRDHSTVLHAVDKIERGMRDDWRIAYDIAHIERLL